MIPNFIIPFAIGAIILNLLVIAVSVRKRHDIGYVVHYILAAEVSILIWVLMVVIQFLILQIKDQILIYSILGNMIIMIGLIAAVLFVSSFLSRNRDIFHLILLMGINLGVYILVFVDPDQEMFFPALNIINVVNALFVLLVSIQLSIYFSQLRAQLDNEIRKRQLLIFQFSVLLGLLGMTVIGYLVIFVDLIYQVHGIVLVFFALFVFLIAFLRDPSIAYILPVKSYVAILANKFGTPLYYKDFTKTEEEDEIIFLSGVIKAITDLMKVYYEQDLKPRLFDFEGKKIIVIWKEKYFIAVLSDRDVWVIRQALSKIVSSLDMLDYEYTQLEDNQKQQVESIITSAFSFSFD